MLLDLDGTVLPENNRPTDRVVRAIVEASKKIPVALASGRVQDDVCHFARLFGLTGPQISDNGATMMDPLTGRAINRHVLDSDVAKQVVSELRGSSSRVLVCDAGRFIDNPDDIKDWQITIVMAKFSNEAEARSWVDRFPAESVSTYATVDNLGEWYIDCTAAGIDKATGARDFAEAVGVDVSELMVVGDGWNDVPMFEVAGTGIAMEGAPVEVQNIATAMTAGIDDDGAGLAIEKYVLGR
ncbi:HAD family hydrolase [Candidatus Lucifugimonas marina]|uniref:HAD family hydrolase n=1 Tax=Candidatus Lucifugimonas marina TaxID=3038979 RepID=UPI00319E2AB2